MLPLYYYTGSGMDYLIGVPEITEIPVPSTFEPCGQTALFAKLNLTCMPVYTQNVTGRTISGQEATYSLSDASSRLVYDLAAFEPSPSARTTFIEFNVFDRTQGNIAISRVVLERTRLGNIVTSRAVATVPQHFVHFGGNNTGADWAVVIGQCVILLVAAVTAVYLAVQCYRSKSLTVVTGSVIAIAILCIASVCLQLSTAISMPLMRVNLGTAKSVQLSEVAATFETVNGINAIIVFSLSILLICQFVSVGLRWTLAVLGLLMVMVCVATVLSTQYGQLWSFSESFMLLTRIGLRRVSGDEFKIFTENGFALISILVFYSLALYAVTGLVVGSFMVSRGSVVATSLVEGRKAGSDERPQSPLIEARPESAGSSQKLSEKDDNLVASVEVLAGRALGQISQLRERMDIELERAREELESAQVKVTGLKNSLKSRHNR